MIKTIVGIRAITKTCQACTVLRLKPQTKRIIKTSL